MHNRISLILAAGVLACGVPLAAQSEGYKLVWADEFNQDGPPNPRNWIHEIGFVRNLELQYYQPDNAWCEKGLLVIEGRREARANPAYEAGSADWRKNRPRAEYTSSCIKTKGLHSWLYGRFEMCARIPTGSGLWPAFWTLGFARPWPGGGEIDIMEYYRELLLANLIWQGKSIPTKTPLSVLGGEEWSRQFHIWRMDWDADRIRIWVDDRLLNDAALDATVNRDAQQTNPYREPHYILVNLAIGGRQGEARPSPNADPSKTHFPVRFEVDYVRVYQQK